MRKKLLVRPTLLRSNFLIPLPKYVAFTILFTVVGITIVLVTKAASPYISIETESTTLSNPSAITTGSDSGASGGAYVLFHTQPSVVTDFCASFPALPNAKPTASNTGPAPSILLTNSGSLSITSPGTVVDAKNISGTIDIQANNVTVKDSRLNSSGFFGIHIFSGVSGTKILNSEIYAPAPAGNYIGLYVEGSNTTVCGNYIHGFENGMTVTGGGTFIQANFIEKLVYVTSPPPHYDGVEIYGGNNQKLWGNNILMTDADGNWRTDTGAINPTAYGGSSIDNVEINGNWFGGGSNTLNLDQQDISTLTNVKVTNNHWYRTTSGICRCNDPPPTIWTGNVWDDTGATITQP